MRRCRRSSTRSSGAGRTSRRPSRAPVLLWGDVRLGNVIFGDDLAPIAVLDWDMASIGAPEHDIGVAHVTRADDAHAAR